MNEIHIELENVKSQGYGLKVAKSDSLKGVLIVKEISPNSVANKAHLKIGDLITKINHKPFKSGRNKLIAEINDSRSTHLSLVISRDTKEHRHQSFMNLSSLSSLVNNSMQNFRNSKSSGDLYSSFPTSKKILDSNFVTEDTIKDFIQEDSLDSSVLSRDRTPSLFGLDDSFQKLDEDPVPSVQLIRKQAYVRSPDEIDCTLQAAMPKYNLKRAVKTPSVTQKDPVYKVKKKTNLTVRSRIVTAPLQRNTTLLVSSHSNLSGSKSLSPNPVYFGSDFEDGNSLSSSSTKAPFLIQATYMPPQQAVDLAMTVNDVEMKILSFKEKIPKPVWKKYLITQETTGVIFECHDLLEMQSSSNSTALNPSFVSVELQMNVWNVNNFPNRFYLPIGQPPHDKDIIRTATMDDIRIVKENLKLDFIINLAKVTPLNQPDVFRILQVEPPEIKLPPAKPKKSISASSDNVKTEPKKPKPPKVYETLSLQLSLLHKTTIVEGVPLIVIICVSIVETFGLREEGIYRKNGNINHRKILEEVVSNETPNKWSSHDEWSNVHTTSSLLKIILRKYTLINKDTTIKLSVIKLDIDDLHNEGDNDRKFRAMMDMIYHLCTHFKSYNSPDENICRLDTFKYIIKHLYRVTLCQEYTKMNADNLAKCFMPNLIEEVPSDDDPEYKTSKMSVMNENMTKMVAFWITYSDAMCEFLEDGKGDELDKMVRNFLNQKPLPNNPKHFIENISNGNEKNLPSLVKEKIEYFTKDAFVSNTNSAKSSHSNVNTPDSYFSRSKNSRLYQSVKQPKKLNARRRNSSGSPIDATKPLRPLEINQKKVTKLEVSSPQLTRKSVVPDAWSSKNFRKKKDSSPSEITYIDLCSLLISGDKKDVPLAVVVCVGIVEKFGIHIDGIYRMNGRNQDITLLDSLVMNNETDKWLQESSIKIWSSMHNTACLMKRILKKCCLIPKEIWMHMSSQFSEKLEPADVKNVLKAAAYHLRVEKRKDPLNTSTRSDCDHTKTELRFRSGTLRYVLKHLHHVSRHELSNRMSSNALAVCFVPVLMEEDYSSDMITLNTKCIQIVQLLIDHCDWIFQWDGRPSEDLYGQTMSDSLEHHMQHYSTSLCHKIHHEDLTPIDNYEEVKQFLKEMIETSFHCSDMDADDLRFYFEHS